MTGVEQNLCFNRLVALPIGLQLTACCLLPACYLPKTCVTHAPKVNAEHRIIYTNQFRSNLSNINVEMSVCGPAHQKSRLLRRKWILCNKKGEKTQSRRCLEKVQKAIIFIPFLSDKHLIYIYIFSYLEFESILVLIICTYLFYNYFGII